MYNQVHTHQECNSNVCSNHRVLDDNKKLCLNSGMRAGLGAEALIAIYDCARLLLHAAPSSLAPA